jgi:hypothetical protein
VPDPKLRLVRPLAVAVLASLAAPLVLVACGTSGKATSATSAPTTAAAGAASTTSTADAEATTTAGDTSTTGDDETSTTERAATVTTAAGDAGAARALDGLLLADVPPGYTVVPDDSSDSGAFDLERAVTADGGADARTRLEAAGFVAGYARYWKGDGSDLGVVLYRYATAAGATSEHDFYVSSLKAQGAGTTPQVTEVPGIDGGTVVRFDINDHTASFGTAAVGRDLVLVVIDGPDASADLTAQLLDAQVARLPG